MEVAASPDENPALPTNSHEPPDDASPDDDDPVVFILGKREMSQFNINKNNIIDIDMTIILLNIVNLLVTGQYLYQPLVLF